MSALVREWPRGSGRWAVVVHHDGRRAVHRCGAGDEGRARAERVARELEDALRRRAAGLPVPTALTVAEAVEAWIETYRHGMRESSRQLYRSLLRRWIAPALGAQPVARIASEDLVGLVRHVLDAGRGPSTATNCLTALARAAKVAGVALDAGEARRLARRAHSAGESRDRGSWTSAQASALLALASERPHRRLYLPALLGLHAGLRRGEVLGLRWSDVDFARARARIARSVVRGRSGAPKGRRARVVTLSPVLMAELRAELERVRRERPWDPAGMPVVTDVTGRRTWEERAFARAWERFAAALEARGIPARDYHSTRHTFATLSLEAGRSIRWVAEQLGHADASLTARVYAHALPPEPGDLSYLPAAEGVTSDVTPASPPSRSYRG